MLALDMASLRTLIGSRLPRERIVDIMRDWNKRHPRPVDECKFLEAVNRGLEAAEKPCLTEASFLPITPQHELSDLRLDAICIVAQFIGVSESEQREPAAYLAAGLGMLRTRSGLKLSQEEITHNVRHWDLYRKRRLSEQELIAAVRKGIAYADSALLAQTSGVADGK